MTVDVERELRAAMEEFTADVQAPPDLLARVRRPSRRRPAFAIAVSAATAAALVAAVIIVVLHDAPADAPAGPVAPLSTYRPSKPDTQAQQRQETAALDRAISGWGRTRGDRAADTSLIARLEAEWAHPTGHPTLQGSFEPVIDPAGPVQVLWVGTTPEGVAGFAVERTTDPAADYWYGVFLPDAGGVPRLAQRGQLQVGFDLGEYVPDHFSFTTSAAHRDVVVIPYDPSDVVRTSFRLITTGEKWRPRWQDVTVRDGAAVAAVPAGADVWGTVVEVAHAGHVLSDQRVDFIATHLVDEGPPQPKNLLGLWCNGCSAGALAGPGYTKAMLDAWAVRHGPAYLPVFSSEWSVGGRARDGSNVLAMQLWVAGQPAHTVVLVDTPHNTVQVLLDEVTDPGKRPVVAVRLTDRLGWLVAAGPASTITGWRVPGGGWHPVAAARTALLPDESAVDLRLVVNGQETVVAAG